MAETLINGFSLFPFCGNDPQQSAMFERIHHEYGGAFRSNTLIGAASGNRKFVVPIRSLKNYSTKTVTFRGREYTHADYVWALYYFNKRTGTPFVIQDERTQQYYLVEFDETDISLQRKLTAFYETTLNFVQVRIDDTTVFDVTKVDSLWGWYKDTNTSGAVLTEWQDSSANNNDLDANGVDIEAYDNIQNGRQVVKMNTISGDSYLTNTGGATIYFALFVLKYHGATFANDSGILTSNVTTAGIIGDSSETKFYNVGHSNYEYEKNGISYLQTNQQAPMNTFGVITARWQGGITLADVQIGKDRDYSDRYAAISIGEIILCDELPRDDEIAEMVDYATTRWAIS